MLRLNHVKQSPNQTSPLAIRIMTYATGQMGYQVVNQDTGEQIDDPMVYEPWSSVFPTLHHVDPGFRIILSGIAQRGDVIKVRYNTEVVNDNRNGLAIKVLYRRISDERFA